MRIRCHYDANFAWVQYFSANARSFSTYIRLLYISHLTCRMRCHHDADYASLQHLSANARSLACRSLFTYIGLCYRSHVTCVKWNAITTLTTHHYNTLLHRHDTLLHHCNTSLSRLLCLGLFYRSLSTYVGLFINFIDLVIKLKCRYEVCITLLCVGLSYGVATISRLLKIIGLFCRI